MLKKNHYPFSQIFNVHHYWRLVRNRSCVNLDTLYGP